VIASGAQLAYARCVALRKFIIEPFVTPGADVSPGAVVIERAPRHTAISQVLGALSSDDRYRRFGNAFEAAPRWLAEKLRHDPAHSAYIARWAGEPVGLLDFVELSAEAEFGLVVLPAYRRRGIGRVLLAALIGDVARSGRIARVFGYCEYENWPIIGLLEQLGFHPTNQFS
jgi:GNAT superfamily N-acetyltransferase